MKIIFIGLLLITGLFNTSCFFSSSNKKARTLPQPHPLAIMQGFTGTTKTEIIVLSPKNQSYNYSILLKKQKAPQTQTRIIEMAIPKSEFKIVTLLISGLKLKEKYQLRISNSIDQLIDKRSFKTLDTAKRKVRIAVASCMMARENYNDLQKKIWKNFLSKKPDIIFFIGDNVYPTYHDIGVASSPQNLWDSFVMTRNQLEIFRSPSLTPILATWDDHDYGLNNGGKEYVYKNQSKKITQGFFGPYGKYKILERGPGVSFIFNAFNSRFIFLDNRSFRSAKKSINGTHWGKNQETWVYKSLKTQKPSWLIQGDQFFGGYHKYESFESHHPKAFQEMLRKLSSLPSPVFFVSGDRHLFEIMKTQPKDINYTSYELTTSGIHARVFPSSSDKYPNPRGIKEIANTHNFALVDYQVEGQKMKIKITAFGVSEKELYSTNFEINRN